MNTPTAPDFVTALRREIAVPLQIINFGSIHSDAPGRDHRVHTARIIAQVDVDARQTTFMVSLLTTPGGLMAHVAELSANTTT